jgi:hypothetical protein
MYAQTKTRKKERDNKGVTTVALVLVLASCVILPLGVFTFEIARFFLIQEELHNITDSAALAGTAAMADSPSPPLINPATNKEWTYSDREWVSMAVAAETFAQNNILQTNFSLAPIPPSSDGTDGYVPYAGAPPPNLTTNMNPTPPTGQTPPLRNGILNIVLLSNTGQQVATGADAATIEVQSYYTDAPLFLGIPTGWNMLSNLGVGAAYTIMAQSSGGLPTVDIMLAFDVSGSLDDATPCAFVNRYWTALPVGAPTQGFVAYSYYTYITPFLSELSNYLGTAPVGSQVNLFAPQNLSYADATAQYNGGGNQQSGNRYPWVFSEAPPDPLYNPNSGSLMGLRALSFATYFQEAKFGSPTTFTPTSYGSPTMPESGLPPGNYNASSPMVWRYDGANDSNGFKHANGLDPTKGSGQNPLTAAGAWTASGTTPPLDNAFTDLVILPPTLTFPVSVVNNGTTYTWQNVAQMVESSRGSCENSSYLTQALGGPYWAKLAQPFNGYGSAPFTPQAGYFNAYWLYVLQNATPISVAQLGAHDFFQTMHLSADTHFGLEAFGGGAGTLKGDPLADRTPNSGSGVTETMGPLSWIDSNYLASSYTTILPLPCLATNPNDNNYNIITGSFLNAPIGAYPPPKNNYVNLSSNLPLQPSTGTDIADSLSQVVTIMSSSAYTRPTAKKAVILFTDGVPWEPGGTEAAAYAAAIAQARTAGSLIPPVPIYTIGLSQSTLILPPENSLLGDGQPNGSGGTNPEGIAYYSAPNQARYFSVQNPVDIEDAFQQIARSLCSIR